VSTLPNIVATSTLGLLTMPLCMLLGCAETEDSTSIKTNQDSDMLQGDAGNSDGFQSCIVGECSAGISCEIVLFHPDLAGRICTTPCSFADRSDLTIQACPVDLSVCPQGCCWITETSWPNGTDQPNLAQGKCAPIPTDASP
jgi:hypothetical protein